MAPTYRTATQTRRGNRSGYAEHDDFDGLPVRQWRQEATNISPPPPPEMTRRSNLWLKELPYGMPKDFQLLPHHSQELLRAVRSGRLYKRPAPPAEEEQAGAEAAVEKADKKDELAPDGFKVKLWKQVPRNSEGATVSHLAKRHKGTICLPSRATTSQLSGPTVTRAKVRRLDAAGNPYEQTVTLADGQQVDGEIISTTVIPLPSAADGENPSQQSTPVRRKPPPPRRKPKGPGRGRKKKLLIPPAAAPRTGEVGVAGSAQVQPESATDQAIKQDGTTTTQQDTEMVDNSVPPSDEDEGEEGDEGDEGEEGGDDEQDDETPDRENEAGQEPHALAPVGQPDNKGELDGDQNHTLEDHHMEDAPPIPDAVPEGSVGHATTPPGADEDPSIMKRPFPLNALSLAAPALASPHFEGSPLKNVILPSPTDPSPAISPVAAMPPAVFHGNDTVMQMDVDEVVPPQDAEDIPVRDAALVSPIATHPPDFALDPMKFATEIDPASGNMGLEVSIQESVLETVTEACLIPTNTTIPAPEPSTSSEVQEETHHDLQAPMPEVPSFEGLTQESSDADATQALVEPAEPVPPAAPIGEALPTHEAPAPEAAVQEQTPEQTPIAEPLPQDPTPPPPPSPPLEPTKVIEERAEDLDLLGGLEAELDSRAVALEQQPVKPTAAEPVPVDRSELSPASEPDPPAVSASDPPPAPPLPLPQVDPPKESVSTTLPNLRGDPDISGS